MARPATAMVAAATSATAPRAYCRIRATPCRTSTTIIAVQGCRSTTRPSRATPTTPATPRANRIGLRAPSPSPVISAAGMRVPDRLADAAVDLLRTLDVAQLKTCPLVDGGCGWLFLDRSRNSSRRWCSMDDCGAKAKARRLTDRRRRARSS